MAEFSSTDFSSDSYAQSRPSYPLTFLDFIVKWHCQKGKSSVALDIGCGTGQVTFPLTKYNFQKVIGVDPGSRMVEKGNEILDSKRNSTDTNYNYKVVEFRQGNAETLELLANIAPESIDLVTAAQCVHWFNHQQAFREIFKVLKPHGTLAYWIYVDPVLVSLEREENATRTSIPVDTNVYNEIYEKYTYQDDRYLGPFWEQPGRGILRDMCRTIQIPTSLFADIVEHRFDVANSNQDSSYTTEKLLMTRLWTVEQYKGYVRSWSSYSGYVNQNGKPATPGEDVANLFADELIRKLKINPTKDLLKIVWSSAYFLARKK